MPKTPDAPRDLMEAVGLRLAATRNVLGLTQEAMAAAVGVERNTYANWEGGSRLARVPPMLKLLERFGIPLEWIYAGRLGGVPYDIAQALEAKSAELGAVIGGSVAEWPMAVDSPLKPQGARRPAGRPPKAPKARVLHEVAEPPYHKK